MKSYKPRVKVETGQYQIRMPVQLQAALVKAAAKNGRRFSEDVRDRLAQSLFDDEWRGANSDLVTFLGQIRELAARVGRYYGAEWHADADAYAAFLEAVNRLIATRPKPKGKSGPSEHAPAVVGEIIFRQFVAENLQIEQGKRHLERNPNV